MRTRKQNAPKQAYYEHAMLRALARKPFLKPDAKYPSRDQARNREQQRESK